jgi:hypothetical protein
MSGRPHVLARGLYCARVMDHLHVTDCGTLFMNAAKNVPRAKFVRLLPRDRALTSTNVHVKAELESNLRKFTALTRGDVIPIVLHGRRIEVEVIDVAPESKANVRCYVRWVPRALIVLYVWALARLCVWWIPTVKWKSVKQRRLVLCRFHPRLQLPPARLPLAFPCTLAYNYRIPVEISPFH